MPEERQEQRRHPRAAVMLVAYLRRRSADQTTAKEKALVKNLSEGGLFIETAALLEPGDVIDFDLHLPDDPPAVALAGIVRWRQKTEPQGIGVEIIGGNSSLRAQLKKYVDQMLRGAAPCQRAFWQEDLP